MNIDKVSKWLKDEVDFLVHNEDYTGGWLELGNGLGICVYWCDGFGKDKRDDVIQSETDSDYALVAAIKLIEPNDISAGGPYYWNFPHYASGDVAVEDISIEPDADYDELAKILLSDYDSVKDLDISETGEIKEKVEECKKMNESKSSLMDSKYKKEIFDYFRDGLWDVDFFEIVANILGRIDDFNDEDDVRYAVDEELIYYVDQWKVMQYYQNPSEANFNEAYMLLEEDIMALASKIAEASKEEIE